MTKEAELFRFDRRRNTDALCMLLGMFDGIVHSDCWKPYELFSPELRQLCHAHLRRDIQSYRTPYPTRQAVLTPRVVGGLAVSGVQGSA